MVQFLPPFTFFERCFYFILSAFHPPSWSHYRSLYSFPSNFSLLNQSVRVKLIAKTPYSWLILVTEIVNSGNRNCKFCLQSHFILYNYSFIHQSFTPMTRQRWLEFPCGYDLSTPWFISSLQLYRDTLFSLSKFDIGMVSSTLFLFVKFVKVHSVRIVGFQCL